MRVTTVIAFAASLILQVGCPLGVTLWYRHRTRAPWALFGYGMLVYGVAQLFTWLPLHTYLDSLVSPRLASEWAAFLWLLATAMATSAVEEAGRLLGYRYLFARGGHAYAWRNGVMYGLGHGSLETLLLISGLTFVHLVAYVALNAVGVDQVAVSLDLARDAELLGALQDIVNTSWIQPLIVAVDRILVLPHQVAWALLVMQAMLSRQKRWFGFAVLYHWSVAVIVPGLARLAGFGVAEAVNLALAGCSVWLILRFRALDPRETLGR